MKKVYFVLVMMISATQICFADSPLTSTEFYKAYLDVPIVKAAADNPKKLSEEAKTYLFDEGNPLDVKIALINAVGWDVDGLTTYLDYKFFQKITYAGRNCRVLSLFHVLCSRMVGRRL